MNRLFASIVGGAVALGLSGCELIGGGGGTGGSTINFTSGYVFVRDNAIFAVDSSNVNDAVQLSEGAELCAEPSISADGKQVVFVQQDGTGWAVRATAVRGGTAVRTLVSGSTRYHTPVFSPDGLKVYVSFDATPSSAHLGSVDAAGTGGFLDLTPSEIDQIRSPTFYPNGTDVLVAIVSGISTQLQKFNLDTRLFTSVATSLGTPAGQLANRVVISPDGSKAAFDARPASGPVTAPRIYVKDITSDTGTATLLTDHPGYDASIDSYPTWAGLTAIGFSTNDGGNDNINEIAAGTTSPAPGTLSVPGAKEGWFGSVP